MGNNDEGFKRGDQIRRIIQDPKNRLAPPGIEYGFIMKPGDGTHLCHFWKMGSEGKALRTLEPEPVDEAELCHALIFGKDLIRKTIAGIAGRKK